MWPPADIVDRVEAAVGVEGIGFEAIPGARSSSKVFRGSHRYFLKWGEGADPTGGETLRDRWTIPLPELVAGGYDPRFVLTEWLDEAPEAESNPSLLQHLAHSHRRNLGEPIDMAEIYLTRVGDAFDRALQTNRISPCLSRKLVTILHRWVRWFDDIEPASALVHGDLRPEHAIWSTRGWMVVGPKGTMESREFDVALLGDATDDYEAVWPLPRGYARRRWLYRLISALERLNRGSCVAEDVETCVAAIIAGS